MSKIIDNTVVAIFFVVGMQPAWANANENKVSLIAAHNEWNHLGYSDSAMGMGVRYNYFFSSRFALEAELLKSGDFSVSNPTVLAESSYVSMGIGAKVFYEPVKDFLLYATTGIKYVNQRIKYSGGINDSNDYSEHELYISLGGEYQLTNVFSLGLEITPYYSNQMEAGSVVLSLGYSF